MATYKVIQDIEAEDKFVGPLTLKQFIFAAIFVVSGYLSFLFVTKHVWFLMIPLLPIMLATGFLAFPWGRDQPTETWLLAKISFYLKPHRRVWDQSGMQELVTITAPKKLRDQFVSNNLSQTEVRDRLHTLADTIDTRGWAIKNVNVNLYNQLGYSASQTNSDRLAGASTLPQQVSDIDVHAADDILDEKNNPTAQKLDQMVAQSAQARRNQMQETINQAREQANNPSKATNSTNKRGGAPAHNFWFMDDAAAKEQVPSGYATFTTQTLAPGTSPVAAGGGSKELSAEEKALLEKVHKDKAIPRPAAYGHMRIIQPLKKQGTAKRPPQTPKKEVVAQSTVPPVTRTPAPDIIALAVNNDRNIASLAREATQNRVKELDDEVVVSLH